MASGSLGTSSITIDAGSGGTALPTRSTYGPWSSMVGAPATMGMESAYEPSFTASPWLKNSLRWPNLDRVHDSEIYTITRHKFLFEDSETSPYSE
ncbi:hypothetical protein Ccrd_004782 [Cynara cardunculus var. scolymus]|uniref:Uncharacterized protein n=1 Tax=Cynara cardunculus var. scolymus TaxID=59895 RepID=A0A103XM42_CYNCS|nr:hypothetical protein Ccrd_004782 [Cynara cardunculus var. scolymus]